MTALQEALTAQLRRELGGRASALAALLPPGQGLELERRIQQAAPLIALQLHSEDDQEVAGTVSDVLHILWPTCDPEDAGHADWWRTPLGEVCAGSLGRRDAQAVTHSVAAAMLGVTKGTISQLVHRGTLDRHPDGGITRASVLARVNRRGG